MRLILCCMLRGSTGHHIRMRNVCGENVIKLFLYLVLQKGSRVTWVMSHDMSQLFNKSHCSLAIANDSLSALVLLRLCHLLKFAYRPRAYTCNKIELRLQTAMRCWLADAKKDMLILMVLCLRQAIGLLASRAMLSTCPSVSVCPFICSFFRPFDRSCVIKVANVILWKRMNWFSCKLVQVVHGARAWKDQLWDREVKRQGHTNPNMDFNFWGLAEATFLTPWIEELF